MKYGSLALWISAVTLTPIGFAYGWLGASRHHDNSRRLTAAMRAAAEGTACLVPLNQLASTSWQDGDRLDILASTIDGDLPLVFDAVVFIPLTTGRRSTVRPTHYCRMPLAEAELLATAMANGTTIRFRASIVPGDWTEPRG